MKMFKGDNQYKLKLIFVVSIFIRIAGDLLFSNFISFSEGFEYFWKTATAIAILTPLVFFYLEQLFRNPISENEQSQKDFFKNLSQWTVLSLLFFTVLAFLPAFISGDLPYYISYLGFLMLAPGLFTLYFITKWLFIRRHNKTKRNVKLMLAILFVTLLFSHFFAIYKVNSLKSTAVLLLMISALISFISAKKNSWLLILPRKGKIRLLVQSFFGLFFSLVFITFFLDDENIFNFVMHKFVYGANAIAIAPFFLALGFFSRLFLATLMSLPTSQVLELQNYEIRSLSYINSIVANSVDINKLLSTVLESAQNSSEASCSWIELYPSRYNEELILTKNIPKELIDKLYRQGNLKEYFSKIEQSLLIPSLPEGAEKNNPDFSYIYFGKSLLAIPLKANNEKIGMLFVLHIDEYWFELSKVYVLESFCNQVGIAIENARLILESLEKERYKKELLIAKEIEEKLLPQKLPTIKNYSISALSVPAIIVGGDYYDIVKLKNQKTCILIGDVSGKGLSAAFYMALLKGVVLALAEESDSASDILKRINATLYRAMEKHIYITLAALLIENDEGDISYARAGHIPLLIKENKEVFAAKPKGLGIGLAPKEMFDSIIEEQKFKLCDNDACILCTDGLIELRNENNEDFGYQHLKQILNSNVLTNSEELIEEIKAQVNSFSKTEFGRDDLTVLTLVFNKSL